MCWWKASIFLTIIDLVIQQSMFLFNSFFVCFYGLFHLSYGISHYAARGSTSVFCLGFFCRARRPAPFSWRPALLKKPKWRPALLTKIFFFFKYQSHMTFSSVLPFLLPTHSVDCAVHLLLSHSRALLVSSALFHPFAALIMPLFFSLPR